MRKPSQRSPQSPLSRPVAPNADLGDSIRDHAMAAVAHFLRRALQQHAIHWAAVAPADLTTPQFVVLLVLAQEGDIDQRTLAERAYLDPSTTTDVVARLRKREYLESRRDPRDSRRNLMRLTAKGRALVRRTIPLADEAEARLLAVLDPHECDQLRAILGKIVRGVPGDQHV
jgi:MarR family transcriptional regulator, temperature-dependent positive regulator of motility